MECVRSAGADSRHKSACKIRAASEGCCGEIKQMPDSGLTVSGQVTMNLICLSGGQLTPEDLLRESMSKLDLVKGSEPNL